MLIRWDCLNNSIAATCLGVAALLPTGAFAVSLEVAKKCNLLVAKEVPPRQAGNPAAGSRQGSGRAQKEYFDKCVANGGSMTGPSDKGSKE